MLREGMMMGSSSDEERVEAESHSSCTEMEGARGGSRRRGGSGEGSIMTVSVRALPLESMVKITSVRGRGMGDSGIEVRLLGRICFTGDVRPVRGMIRPVDVSLLHV